MELIASVLITTMLTFMFTEFYVQAYMQPAPMTHGHVNEMRVAWDWVTFLLYIFRMILMVVVYYVCNNLFVVFVAIAFAEFLSAILYVFFRRHVSSATRDIYGF